MKPGLSSIIALFSAFVLLSGTADAQSFTEWKDQNVNEINREAMHSDYFAYTPESYDLIGKSIPEPSQSGNYMRGMAWLDTGTYDGLLEASNFIATIEKRQGLYVSCIEEIAYANGWLSKEKLLELAKGYKTDYGRYLEFIANNN